MTFGLIVLALGFLLLPAYGIYSVLTLVQEELQVIPLFIRISFALIFTGITVLMVYVIRDRIIDWKKEKKR